MSTNSKALKQSAGASTGGTINSRNHVLCVGVLLRTCALIALIVLFNLFPEKIGVILSADNPLTFVPLLAPEFSAHLPWLNLLWGLALALNVVLLVDRRWRPGTRWADWGLSMLAMIILLRLLIGGPIVGLHPEWMSGQSPARESLVHTGQRLAPVLNVVTKGVLAVALVTLIAESSRKLCRLIGGNPTQW